MKATGVSVALTASILAACSIGKPLPAATTYNLEHGRTSPTRPESGRTERLSVGRIQVAAPYNRPALVYRLSAVRFVSDPYHEFLAAPAAILAQEISEWLNQTGVTAASRAAPATLMLEVTVTELYGDFRKETAPAAVMSLHCTVINTRAGAQVSYDQLLTRRIALKGQTPDALVQGYDTALSEILTQLSHDLSAS